MISLFRSFTFAWNGIARALRTERNFRVQWLCGLAVLMIMNLLHFAHWQNTVLVVLTALVLAFELLNSAVERVCDSSGHEFSLAKKHAKDFAAGAVLVVATAAGIIFARFIGADFARISEAVNSDPWPYLSIAVICILCIPCALAATPGFFHAALFSVGFLLHVMLVANHDAPLTVMSGAMALHLFWALALTQQIASFKKLAAKVDA